jgi:SAM-dependent methyltransferase
LKPDKRLLFSIGLLSAAVIAFQLVLIQILSIVQWYHFAYMVISVALLGFGAAGTILSLFRKPLINAFEWLLPLLMILGAAAMALVVGVSQLSSFRFDSYLLFVKPGQVWRLLFTYLLFLVPFLSCALGIGLVFVKFADDIGRLYFVNLLGSGLGGVVALGLIWFYLPRELPAAVSILPLVSAMLIVPQRRRRHILAAGVVALIIVVFRLLNPPALELSQFKSLKKTLNLPGAEIILEKNSPYGLIQVVSSPALRYAPGLSLTYQDPVPLVKAIFNNGNWFDALLPWNREDTTTIMNYTTAALPYAIKKSSRHVLILNGAAGSDIAAALTRQAAKVTAVEPNGVVLSLLKNEFAAEIDSLPERPSVTVYQQNARTFLLSDTAKYDLIILPMTGAFGGTSGLFALQEQYLLTKEAFREMRQLLTPGGAISISCWMEYPPLIPLKILATMVEVLEAEGIREPGKYIAAARSWATLTFVLTASPISTEDVRNTRQFCERMMFDPAILSGVTVEERSRYNRLQDPHFFDYLDEILSLQTEKLYAEYDFNIRPASDNQPYFSRFLRWKSLPHLTELFGEQAVPFFEIGYLIVALTLAQISFAALVLILLPLFRLGWKGGEKGWTPLYFSGIGLGYMFVEIVLIQRFILYFGSPIYAAAAVISVLLVCSGGGSYFSSRLKLNRKILLIFAMIIALLVLYALILTPALQATIALPLGFKLFLAFLALAPLAFLMGMPFPLGIRILSRRNQAEIPWAWGINGCVSVISTALATIIAVELGFHWVMIAAALGYCLPLIGNTLLIKSFRVLFSR